jgi:predicted TIM-barrel enzyme
MIILPVIHYSTLSVALENAEIAFQNGCDGVFVINMDYTPETDLEIPAVCAHIKKLFPNKKVGANFLYADFITMFVNAVDSIDMIWTDDLIPEEHDEVIRLQGFVKDIDIFESFAFKYKKADPDFVNTGNNILAKGRIPTTSGSGTGHAAPLEKLIQLSELPRLALASGLTPDNVSMFKPYITHALVATGISDSFYTFDPTKVKDFVQAVRG